jgi:hypothetical protein
MGDVPRSDLAFFLSPLWLAHPMPNGHTVLELASLPERHPVIGTALLHTYAPSLIVRLRDSPTRQPPDTMDREVEINHRRRGGDGSEVILSRRFGWSGLDPEVARVCEQLPRTKNRNALTEDAAIAAAALLIHDLENGTLETVLQIGSGGDYLVRIPELSTPIQIEISGVTEDPSGSESRMRLNRKSDQVLSRARVGFVSITTFSHGPQGIVHSYLHFTKAKVMKVQRSKPRKRPPGKGGKK